MFGRKKLKEDDRVQETVQAITECNNIIASPQFSAEVKQRATELLREDLAWLKTHAPAAYNRVTS